MWAMACIWLKRLAKQANQSVLVCCKLSPVRSDAKMESPDELVVEGILQPQWSNRGVYTDACSIAVAAARLPSRACRVPQDSLTAVQICSIVKE